MLLIPSDASWYSETAKSTYKEKYETGDTMRLWEGLLRGTEEGIGNYLWFNGRWYEFYPKFWFFGARANVSNKWLVSTSSHQMLVGISEIDPERYTFLGCTAFLGFSLFAVILNVRSNSKYRGWQSTPTTQVGLVGKRFRWYQTQTRTATGHTFSLRDL